MGFSILSFRYQVFHHYHHLSIFILRKEFLSLILYCTVYFFICFIFFLVTFLLIFIERNEYTQFYHLLYVIGNKKIQDLSFFQKLIRNSIQQLRSTPNGFENCLKIIPLITFIVIITTESLPPDSKKSTSDNTCDYASHVFQNFHAILPHSIIIHHLCVDLLEYLTTEMVSKSGKFRPKSLINCIDLLKHLLKVCMYFFKTLFLFIFFFFFSYIFFFLQFWITRCLFLRTYQHQLLNNLPISVERMKFILLKMAILKNFFQLSMKLNLSGACVWYTNYMCYYSSNHQVQILLYPLISWMLLMVFFFLSINFFLFYTFIFFYHRCDTWHFSSRLIYRLIIVPFSCSLFFRLKAEWKQNWSIFRFFLARAT